MLQQAQILYIFLTTVACIINTLQLKDVFEQSKLTAVTKNMFIPTTSYIYYCNMGGDKPEQEDYVGCHFFHIELEDFSQFESSTAVTIDLCQH